VLYDNITYSCRKYLDTGVPRYFVTSTTVLLETTCRFAMESKISEQIRVVFTKKKKRASSTAQVTVYGEWINYEY